MKRTKYQKSHVIYLFTKSGTRSVTKTTIGLKSSSIVFFFFILLFFIFMPNFRKNDNFFGEKFSPKFRKNDYFCGEKQLKYEGLSKAPLSFLIRREAPENFFIKEVLNKIILLKVPPSFLLKIRQGVPQ